MQAIDKSVKKTQPLLTIAIPTYNRAPYLDLCLSKISDELDNLNAEQRMQVNIYVSNNASTDNTSQIISQHQLKMPEQFTVKHNEENIGMERNIAQCYTSATTPYVWILGDDDVILNRGIAIVLDVLYQHDVDILRVGSKSYIKCPNENRKVTDHSITNDLQLFNSAIEFTSRTNIYLTFISCLIVRTGHCSPESYEAVRGSLFPQMCWVSSLLCDGRRFGIINNVIIAAKANNSGGYSLVQEFGINLQKITNISLKEKPELIKIIQNGIIVNFFPIFIMILRNNQNNFTTENDLATTLKIVYGTNWRYYIFLVPLIKLPLFGAKFYSIFLKFLRRTLSPILI